MHGEQAADLLAQRMRRIAQWYGVAAAVALASTPLVYQLTRIASRRLRAELVQAASDCERREGGAVRNAASAVTEVDVVEEEEEEDGGISITYSTSRQLPSESGARVIRFPSDAFTWRFGRKHSWALSDFSRRVLAAQRAPDRQFADTCGAAATRQYVFIALRWLLSSCATHLSAQVVMYVACAALGRVITLDAAAPHSGGDASLGTSHGNISSAGPPHVAIPVAAMWHSFLTSSLLCSQVQSATAPSAAAAPPVSSLYVLYVFSASAQSSLARLFPRLHPLAVVLQRVFVPAEPPLPLWRDSNAAADSVWRSLTPKGFFFASLLQWMPLRVYAGLRMAARRGWMLRAARDSRSPTVVLRSAMVPPIAAGVERQRVSQPAQLKSQQRRRQSAVPAVAYRVLRLAAGDVGYAALVFCVLFSVSAEGGGWSRLRLFHHDGGELYNVFSWMSCVANVMGVCKLC